MSPTIFALLDVLNNWVHKLRSHDPLSIFDVTHVRKGGSPCWHSSNVCVWGRGCPGTGAPGNKASIHVILLKYSQTKVCLLNWQWNEVYKSSGYSPSNRYIDRTKVPFNNSWLQTGSMYIPLMFYTCPETSLWSHTSRYWEWSYLEWVWLIMWCPSNKCGCLQTANTWRGTSSQWGYVSLSLIVCMPVIYLYTLLQDLMPCP